MIVTKPYVVELAKTLSAHWYHVWKAKPNGDKGRYVGAFPSATTILNAYPQSAHLTKWIAENGWNESQKIKTDAGKAGTRIHHACDLLEAGTTLHERDYSVEEWYKIASFVDWHRATQPTLIATEFPVFSPKGRYAGTLDRLYVIDGKNVLLDLKSGSGIHDHFPLQFAAYAQAVEETTDLKVDFTAALQLGASNKDGYRYVDYVGKADTPDTKWREHLKVFKHVHATWMYDNYGARKTPKDPPVLDLPPTLTLKVKE